MQINVPQAAGRVWRGIKAFFGSRALYLLILVVGVTLTCIELAFRGRFECAFICSALTWLLFADEVKAELAFFSQAHPDMWFYLRLLCGLVFIAIGSLLLLLPSPLPNELEPLNSVEL